jgi:hypothetical protein
MLTERDHEYICRPLFSATLLLPLPQVSDKPKDNHKYRRSIPDWFCIHHNNLQRIRPSYQRKQDGDEGHGLCSWG